MPETREHAHCPGTAAEAEDLDAITLLPMFDEKPIGVKNIGFEPMAHRQTDHGQRLLVPAIEPDHPADGSDPGE